MIVLGLDSATTTGWALVRRDAPGQEILLGSGTIKPTCWEDFQDFAQRMITRADAPDHLAIEDCYLDKNPATLKVLARRIGHWEMVFGLLGLESRVVLADVWQRGVLTGLIRASSERAERKKAANLWVKTVFKKNLPEDECDAIGLACWEARRLAYDGLVKDALA